MIFRYFLLRLARILSGGDSLAVFGLSSVQYFGED